MSQVEIPQKLIDLVKARRIIPFVGAGFSLGLNLPDWDTLLSKLAEDIEGSLPYQKVKELCNDDYLRIAEYYFLISDHRIGPLRHTISSAFQGSTNTLLSAPHVELLNLGAPQIYTTNYDDLIEKTFKMLKQPVEVIALPKDVATSSGSKTQVVKYHGDLRHEQTLVLTESSYYARLDLDSPMDLKFRSDLLGRSVLFMGYSFRDINIRIIWFKLMGMMRDVSLEDRPTSYIVTFAYNPVLERLYDEVGIKTICLDPSGKVTTKEARSRLLSDFLTQLATTASHDGHIPGQPTTKLFYSTALTDGITCAFDELDESTPRRPLRRRSSQKLERLIAEAARRTLLSIHQSALVEIMKRAYAVLPWHSIELAAFAVNFLRQLGPNPTVTAIIARTVLSGDGRDFLFDEDLDWKVIWSEKIPENTVSEILERFERELRNHESGMFDHDLAFCYDIAKRISMGQIFDVASSAILKRVNDLLNQTIDLYSSVCDYTPTNDGAPDVSMITEEIDEREREIPSSDSDAFAF